MLVFVLSKYENTIEFCVWVYTHNKGWGGGYDPIVTLSQIHVFIKIRVHRLIIGVM